MSAIGKRIYSSELKLQVVLEALQSDEIDAEFARAYDVHLVTLSISRQTFFIDIAQI